MTDTPRWLQAAVLCMTLALAPASAFAVYGDARPDAPELAARGKSAVGVRTLDVLHRDQLNILAAQPGQPIPHYDRPLRLEIWYPARLASGQRQATRYSDVLGTGANDPQRPNTPFQFDGRATRDAAPDGQVHPLVILSHGYPGSRLQMSYLTEFLASHGYVVVAIDHTESTRADKAGFASTLLNRPLDILFVLQRIDELAKPASGSFLAGTVDTAHTALMGYSMGGYGVLNAAGVGVSPVAVGLVPGGALQARAASEPSFQQHADARIRALVAFAPWGGRQGIFAADSLARLRVPSLFIAGDQDDVAGYADGIHRLFEGAQAAERYLLVYQNARHNVAPNPPPPAASANPDDFSAYAEPAWDSSRINNINQHFVLAFLDQQLRGIDRHAYLELTPLAADGVWSRDAQGQPKADDSYWKGFPRRSALGLEFHHLAPGQAASAPTPERVKP
ncbi:MAG: hypothetical protein GAK45_01826 [Pseudomonas citronellolis]|nr:MAG: hypothetical protein GAK45_01826 [Pseudomonas citronellolis]